MPRSSIPDYPIKAEAFFPSGPTELARRAGRRPARCVSDELGVNAAGTFPGIDADPVIKVGSVSLGLPDGHRGRQGGQPHPRRARRRQPPRRRDHHRLPRHRPRGGARRHHGHVQRGHHAPPACKFLGLAASLTKDGLVLDEAPPATGPAAPLGTLLNPVLDPLQQLTAPVQAPAHPGAGPGGAEPQRRARRRRASTSSSSVAGRSTSDSGAAGYASSGLSLTFSYKGKEQAALGDAHREHPARAAPQPSARSRTRSPSSPRTTSPASPSASGTVSALASAPFDPDGLGRTDSDLDVGFAGFDVPDRRRPGLQHAASQPPAGPTGSGSTPRTSGRRPTPSPAGPSRPRSSSCSSCLAALRPRLHPAGRQRPGPRLHLLSVGARQAPIATEANVMPQRTRPLSARPTPTTSRCSSCSTTWTTIWTPRRASPRPSARRVRRRRPSASGRLGRRTCCASASCSCSAGSSLRSASSSVVLGWWGASRTPYAFEQTPYLISGGLLGLGLVFLGSFFYFAHWLTQLVKEHREQSAAILAALERLGRAARPVAAPLRRPKPLGPEGGDLVAPVKPRRSAAAPSSVCSPSRGGRWAARARRRAWRENRGAGAGCGTPSTVTIVPALRMCGCSAASRHRQHGGEAGVAARRPGSSQSAPAAGEGAARARPRSSGQRACLVLGGQRCRRRAPARRGARRRTAARGPPPRSRAPSEHR